MKLRATFPNADERLFPNEFVNAHLLLQTLAGVLIVPTPAIQNGPSGNFVYVVKTATVNGHDVNKVAVANVKAGYAHADRTVIQSGLTAGDKVVIDGTDRLKDGAVVMVPGPGQKGAAPAGGRRGHGGSSEQPAE